MTLFQEHPVVITKFIRGAREVEVDAVAKNGKVAYSTKALLAIQAKYTTCAKCLIMRFLQCSHKVPHYLNSVWLCLKYDLS